MTDLQLIRTPADLRPGDIFFGPISGPVGLGVGLGQLMLREGFRVGGLSVQHVAIVVDGVKTRTRGDGSPWTEEPYLVQAMPSGAEEVAFTFQDHWTDRCAFVRLPELYPGQAEDAAAVARLMVREEVSYSFASYAYLAAYRWGLKTPHVERWIDRRREPVPFRRSGHWPGPIAATVALPVEAICSVLVDQAWSLAGQRVMDGVARQAVTPGAMAGQLWRRSGAVWALPAWPMEKAKGEATSWVVNGG